MWPQVGFVLYSLYLLIDGITNHVKYTNNNAVCYKREVFWWPIKPITYITTKVTITVIFQWNLNFISQSAVGIDVLLEGDGNNFLSECAVSSNNLMETKWKIN